MVRSISHCLAMQYDKYVNIVLNAHENHKAETIGKGRRGEGGRGEVRRGGGEGDYIADPAKGV